MEVLSVIMLYFAVCFIASIITLVFLNFIILMSEEDKSKIAEKSKDLGLTAKVLSDKPKTKVLTRDTMYLTNKTVKSCLMQERHNR